MKMALNKNKCLAILSFLAGLAVEGLAKKKKCPFAIFLIFNEYQKTHENVLVQELTLGHIPFSFLTKMRCLGLLLQWDYF